VPAQYNSRKIPHLENISVWYDVSNPKCFNITEAIYGGNQPLPYTTELQASQHFEKYVGTSTNYDFSHLTLSTNGPYTDAGTGNTLHIKFNGPSRPYLGLRDLSGNNRSATLFTNPLTAISSSSFSGYDESTNKSRTVILPLKGKWYFEPWDLKHKEWHAAEIGHLIENEEPDREHNNSDTDHLKFHMDNAPAFAELEEIGVPAGVGGNTRHHDEYSSDTMYGSPYQKKSTSSSGGTTIDLYSARQQYWLSNWEGFKNKYGLVGGRPAGAFYAAIKFGYVTNSNADTDETRHKRVNGHNSWRLVIDGMQVRSRSLKDQSDTGWVQGQLKPGDVIDCQYIYQDHFKADQYDFEYRALGMWEIGPPVLVDFDQSQTNNTDGFLSKGTAYHAIRPWRSSPNDFGQFPDPKYTPGQFHHPDPRLILMHENSVKIENLTCENAYTSLTQWDSVKPAGQGTPVNGYLYANGDSDVAVNSFVCATGMPYEDIDLRADVSNSTSSNSRFYNDPYGYKYDFERTLLVNNTTFQNIVDLDDDSDYVYHVFLYTDEGVLALYEIMSYRYPLDNSGSSGITNHLVRGVSYHDGGSVYRVNTRQYENKSLLKAGVTGYTMIIVREDEDGSYLEAGDNYNAFPPVYYPEKDLPGFIQLNAGCHAAMGLTNPDDPSTPPLWDDPKHPFVGKALYDPESGPAGDFARDFDELSEFSIFTWVRKSTLQKRAWEGKDGGSNFTASDGVRYSYYSPIVSAGIHHFEFIFNNYGQLQFHMSQASNRRGSWVDTTGDYPDLNVLRTTKRVMWGSPEWVLVGMTYSASTNKLKLFVNGKVEAELTGQTLFPIGGTALSGDYEGYSTTVDDWGNSAHPTRIMLGTSSVNSEYRTATGFTVGSNSLTKPHLFKEPDSTNNLKPYSQSKVADMHMSQFYMWHDTVLSEQDADQLFVSTKGRFGLTDLSVPSVLPGASAINSNVPGDQTGGGDTGGGDTGGGDTTTTQPIYETITNLIQNYDEDTPSGVVAAALEDTVNGAGVRVLAVVDKNRQIEKLEKINSIADLPQPGSSNNLANDYGTGWNDSHFSANIELGEIANFDDVDLDGKKYLGIAGFHDGNFLGVTFLIFNDQSNSTMDDPVNVVDLINHNEMTGSSTQLGHTRAFQIEGFTYDVNPGNNNSIASPDIIKTTTLGTSQSWILSTNPQLDSGINAGAGIPNYFYSSATRDVLSKDDGAWAWQAGVAIQGNGTQHSLNGGYGVANFNNTDGTSAIKAFWGTDNVYSSFRYYIFT